MTKEELKQKIAEASDGQKIVPYINGGGLTDILNGMLILLENTSVTLIPSSEPNDNNAAIYASLHDGYYPTITVSDPKYNGQTFYIRTFTNYDDHINLRVSNAFPDRAFLYQLYPDGRFQFSKVEQGG